jgi:hypothetical protein
MIKYKKCKCEDDYWEEIVVQKDSSYQNKNVIYYHCSFCDEDFRIEDFETNKELFYIGTEEQNATI